VETFYYEEEEEEDHEERRESKPEKGFRTRDRSIMVYQ
jgi:hypothetical protein